MSLYAERKPIVLSDNARKQAAELEKKYTEEYQKKIDKKKEDNKFTDDQAKAVVQAVRKSFFWGLGIGALITVIIYKIRS
jgi:hypothetical protein